MKFSVEGSRIVCRRRDNTVEEPDRYRHVVEFDAHVDGVPPHVGARLTAGEVQELKKFMADRRRIKANPAEKNMLEALPGLLDEAVSVVDSVDEVNVALYEELEAALKRLQASLGRVRPSAVHRGPTTVERMKDRDAQKERLDQIRRYI
jgi:hypothetical protein